MDEYILKYTAACSLFCASLGATHAATIGPAPPAAPSPVTDTIQGVRVPDPYRWLENAADPKVKAWSAAQNARTRAYLDALPQRAAIKAELKRLMASTTSYGALSARGAQVFATYTDSAQQQPVLAVMNAAADPATRRAVLDPNRMDPSGHTEIDWWVASPDGALVAVSLSQNGSEDGTLHLYRAATGEEVAQPIPDVQHATAGGSLAWAADGKGFWYTRYPGQGAPEAERRFNSQVYFHTLGADWHADTLALGSRDGLERISEIVLNNDAARPAIVATVARGDGGAFSHYVLRANASPIRLCGYADQIVTATLGPDDAIYALSRDHAPNGKIVRLAPPFAAGALAQAPVIVPESRAAMRTSLTNGQPGLTVTADRLLVSDLVGGPADIRIFTHDGHPAGAVPLPPVADVGEIDPMAGGSVLVKIYTYLRPSTFLRWTPRTNGTADTALSGRTPVDLGDAQVTRVFATSKDGTKIPINIISRRGLRLDGQNPTVLYGYGGYGISMTPQFQGAAGRVWLDAGGVFAIANIRGGAEYGESWHTGGALLHKQNVFDDFAAAGQFLIDRKYTAHDRLALFGESNGGLLMGAMITQHPNLARAVVSRVGIYDMMRVELDPNGAYNTTEFGTVKDAAQFRAMLAYSPYHHVRAGTAYPAVLLTAGDTDGRVNPMHSRKFTAALQAADPGGGPILLATSASSGHGMGDPLDAIIDREADIQAFLMDQLGAHLPAARALIRPGTDRTDTTRPRRAKSRFFP